MLEIPFKEDALDSSFSLDPDDKVDEDRWEPCVPTDTSFMSSSDVSRTDSRARAVSIEDPTSVEAFKTPNPNLTVDSSPPTMIPRDSTCILDNKLCQDSPKIPLDLPRVCARNDVPAWGCQQRPSPKTPLPTFFLPVKSQKSRKQSYQEIQFLETEKGGSFANLPLLPVYEDDEEDLLLRPQIPIRRAKNSLYD